VTGCRHAVQLRKRFYLKSAIVVPSKDKPPSVIDTLITAVRSGELDAQMAQASR
jgi:DNA-binding transcriptional regulator LsrR (DeoR family)